MNEMPAAARPEEDVNGERASIGASFSEDLIATMRARIGRKKPAHRPWNRGANVDTIRHYAEGIGDTNPLWFDEDYAESSPWGRQFAPPAYLYTLGNPFGGGMAGIHGLFGGTAFHIHQPVYSGDRVSSTIELADLTEHEGRLSGKMFRQVERQEYWNQRGEMVAHAEHWALRFERDTARQRADDKQGRYDGRELTRYTPDGIRGIDEEYADEVRQGAEPLDWEDVAVGQLIPQVVKGPLRVTDIICYMMGGGPGPYARGHAVNVDFRRDHPSVYITNEQGIPDTAESVHWSPKMAQSIATPGPYDFGTERPAWMGHCLTNWIGDHGWVEHLRTELRGVNVVGDTTRVSGRVADKRVEEGRHLVDLKLWCRNQLGEVTAKGEARVRLPGREAGDPGAAAELSFAQREATAAPG
jgi:acyl dehydratase